MVRASGAIRGRPPASGAIARASGAIRGRPPASRTRFAPLALRPARATSEWCHRTRQRRHPGPAAASRTRFAPLALRHRHGRHPGPGLQRVVPSHAPTAPSGAGHHGVAPVLRHWRSGQLAPAPASGCHGWRASGRHPGAGHHECARAYVVRMRRSRSVGPPRSVGPSSTPARAPVASRGCDASTDTSNGTSRKTEKSPMPQQLVSVQEQPVHQQDGTGARQLSRRLQHPVAGKVVRRRSEPAVPPGPKGTSTSARRRA
jgi:hypothetical protein